MDSNDAKLKEIEKVKERINKKGHGKVSGISIGWRKFIYWLSIVSFCVILIIVPFVIVQKTTNFGINTKNPNLNPIVQIDKNASQKGEN